MLGGGKENSVTLVLPRGRLMEYEGDSIWELESPKLGEYLSQPEVKITATRSFVDQDSVLIHTYKNGERSVEFNVNPLACAHVLGSEAEKFLQITNHGSMVKELVGASRFCLEASDMPAAQRWQMQLGLEGIEEADHLIQTALDDSKELQMLGGARDLDLCSGAFVEADDETRRKMSVAAAYRLVDAFSHVANTYVFEKGAYAAVGFAEASGDEKDALEISSRINSIRPEVYARALEKLAKDAVESVKFGNETKVEVHLSQIEGIASIAKETFSQLDNSVKKAKGEIYLSLAVSKLDLAEKQLNRSPDKAMESWKLGKEWYVRAELVLRGLPYGFKDLVAADKRQGEILNSIHAQELKNQHAVAVAE